MTIITIHVLEALVVLLIGLKLLRIRTLYMNSVVPAHAQPAPKARAKKRNENPVHQKLQSISTKTNSNLFLKTLPEPEVLFAPEHEELVLTDIPEAEEQKSILNSYIDDFFYESPEFIFDEKPVSSERFDLESSNDDDFITVQEENAEMVRALQALNREMGVSARA